ncbi:conjugal transfer protein MobA [Flavobacterium notoginsengisoli]|uniref:conjugal transfer protein MobA n=1 Tax=Flavobacterium notoginsengisoli TaxID=1478199 RepID=UPI003633892E
MEENNKARHHKTGRPAKNDPAVHRYSISLTAEENARFLSLFEQSGMNIKAHFITACIFQKGITTIKVDKTAVQYYIRLTSLFSQFRAVGVNYNQVVKIMNRNFSEKKAPVYLYKLVQQTLEFALLAQKIIQLTAEFEEKHLKK